MRKLLRTVFVPILIVAVALLSVLGADAQRPGPPARPPTVRNVGPRPPVPQPPPPPTMPQPPGWPGRGGQFLGGNFTGGGGGQPAPTPQPPGGPRTGGNFNGGAGGSPYASTTPENVTIKIVKPGPDEKFVFTEVNPGKLEITAEAAVTPAGRTRDVVWEVQDIKGAKKTITPTKGQRVKITFEKLPADNAEFGPKKIIARLDNQQAEVTVRVFFPKDATNNPGDVKSLDGKKVPNWFYYWQKGKVVAGLDQFRYDPSGATLYGANLPNGTLVLGPSAAGPFPARKVPLKDVAVDLKVKKCGGKFVEVPRTDGIDTTARSVVHELEHKRLDGGSSSATDRDGDGVKDGEEIQSTLCLDRLSRNTHELRPEDLFVMLPGDDKLFTPKPTKKGGKGGPEGKGDTPQDHLNAYGDSEVLAAVAEQNYEGSRDPKKDWSKGGHQWNSR